ncbi:porphobilinogen synthase [Candidatus Jidaibacter acanthamoebae]|uniref:porphobilinogen synthase n=1 Tax=Candidatus Jidaibacter acanthamoebae TaxID=86105 RepID=UPI000AE31FC1|nr:porphobilinogen synthase [Candidatus Jidaibacter acanthamoeba]
MKAFPYTRLRRNRKEQWSRDMVAENHIFPSNLILPVFVKEGKEESEPIASMPGVNRLSIDNLVKAAKEARSLGILAIALFPYIEPALKDDKGSEALNKDNLLCRAIKELKDKVPELGVITDVALDPYTSHGHDGIINARGDIINDESIEVLCEQALILAQSGCDIVAPSDMMDGRIGAIRETLEEEGLTDTQILAYAAKYASCFYGPFRGAVGSQSLLGGKDKKTYQMDFANSDEALREVELDISEGADMVMIKPGLPYLDIIRRVKDNYNIPIFAYQVSGEYSMIKAASAAGFIDEQKAFLETMLCFKRAGANGIFTYAAIAIARWLW